jgi:hypothetical protein
VEREALYQTALETIIQGLRVTPQANNKEVHG